jgi:drug/metabolite transporter (DMT)-like permease
MFLLLIVSVIWALSFGLTAQVSGLGAPFVTAARTLLAALVFLPFLNVKGMPPGRVLAFAGIGALQFGLMYLLYIASFRWLRPSEVALFTVFTPLFVTLVSDLFEGRLSWSVLVAAGIAVVASGLGFFLFNAGARRTDIGTLAIFNNMKIPLAILAAGLLFREAVDWSRLAVGGAVIAIALGLNSVTGERP